MHDDKGESRCCGDLTESSAARRDRCPLCALDPGAAQTRLRLRLNQALAGGDDAVAALVTELLENEPGKMYSCEECRGQFEERLEALGDETLKRVASTPPQVTKKRLLERLVAGAGRFSPFVRRLGQLFELDEPTVEGLLARIDDAASWQLRDDGVAWLPIAEALCAAPGAAFLRLSAGSPWVDAAAAWRGLVLQGQGTCDTALVMPGDVVTVAPGASLRAAAAEVLLLGVVRGG